MLLQRRCRRLQLLLLSPLLVAPASALGPPPQFSAAYAPTSLLALRVGDGLFCPSANTSCSVAAPLFLDEYDLLTGALVSTVAVAGATLSASDQYVGSLSRSGDGTCVSFGANAVPAGTPATVLAPFPLGGVAKNFPGSRVVVRVNASGLVDSSTRVTAADYNGILHAACTFDGSGFWLAGNASTSCVSYVAFGSNSSVNVAHDANCATAYGPQNGLYAGCAAAGSPNSLFFARTADGGAFIDQPVPNTQSSLWTAPGGLTLYGLAIPDYSYGSHVLYYSQIILNRAQSLFWVIEPWGCGIVYGNAPSKLPSMPAGTVGYLLGGDQTGICAVSGLALSPDESVLYFSSGRTIYWVPSVPSAGGLATTPTQVPSLTANVFVTLPALFFEFRGISIAPQSCSSPGLYCAGGIMLPALPCTVGYYCPGSALPSACSPGIYCPVLATSNSVPCPAGMACPGNGAPPRSCPPGTFSAGGLSALSCTNCNPGILCGALASNNTTPCPPGFVCPGGGAAASPCPAGAYSAAGAASCTVCSPTIYCASASTNNTTPCPAGLACAGAGAAPAACASGFFALMGAASCTLCPRNSLSFTSASSCICNPGYISNGLADVSLVCTPCPANTYSYGGSATACSSCPSTAYFTSSSQGCSPALGGVSNPGLPGVGFALSGASAEGVSAFATVANSAGLSYVLSPFGTSGGALSLAAGSYLASAPQFGNPPYLPSSNGPMSATAWVKCAPPASGQASVLEWGAASPVGDASKFGIVVASVNSSLFAATGASVSIFAGSTGPTSIDTDNTVALSATLSVPLGLTIDYATGEIFVVESGLSLRVVNSSSGAVTTFLSTAGFEAQGFFPGETTFAAVDASTVYVTGLLGVIYAVSRSTHNVSVLAGGGASGAQTGTANGVGTNALFTGPYGLAIDRTSSYLYMTELFGCAIRQIVIATAQVTTVAGGGASGTECAFADGRATSALFEFPAAVAPDAAGILWVSDFLVVRRIVLATQAVTTVVGLPGVAGYVDGVGSSARFNGIVGVVVDATSSFLYLSDAYSSAVRKVELATYTVTTLARVGTFGLALGLDGSLFSTCQSNNYIVKIVQVPLLPACGDGRWHHLALTQGDGAATTRKAYLDGALVSSVAAGETYTLAASGTAAASALTLRVGWNGLAGPPSGASDLFAGSVSDLRIYSHALAQADVIALMQPPVQAVPTTSGSILKSSGLVAAEIVVPVACGLLIALFVMRRRRQRLRKQHESASAAASAAPDFAVDFSSDELTVTSISPNRSTPGKPATAALKTPTTTLSSTSAASVATRSNPLAVAAGHTPSSTERVPTQHMHEVAWADLVPDLSHAPMAGGFGVVFVARWVPKRKLVAVKVLKSAVLSAEQSRGAVQMLLAEAQGLMRASDGGVNEHIVQVFGVAQGKADGWQTVLRVSKEADARKRDRQLRAAARRSKAAGLSVAQTWVGDSTEGAATAAAESATATVTTPMVSMGGGLAPVAEAPRESEPQSPGGASANEDESESDDETTRARAGAGADGDAARPAPFLFGLVMSFENGGSLADKLFPHPSKHPSWPARLVDKLRVLKEAASGLYGLHAIGIVHGDLKPENVLLGGGGGGGGSGGGGVDGLHVRLADFGLATIKSSAARASRISTIALADEKRGTWPYMAPEMWRSKTALAATASRSTDVFAFGTLMHEVLSARVPWKGYTETERLLALQRGESLDEAELPKETPSSIVALVSRCLSLDRAQRPRMAEVLSTVEMAHENVLSGRFDVFLSYAWGRGGARKALADELYLALRAAGLRVWLDEVEMGLDLRASMSEGIAKSDVVVALVSPAYAASANCMHELREATRLGKPLVTCLAEPGFWKSWGLAPDGSGTRAVPDDHEVVALARLNTHLFVDLGAASKVDWRADSVPANARKKLRLPEALPRLLALVDAARRAGHEARANEGPGGGESKVA